VLQCVAACCSELHYSVLQHVAEWYSLGGPLRVAVCCTIVCCSVLQSGIFKEATVCCNVLQCVAACCSVLQRVAVCCSVLQSVAL